MNLIPNIPSPYDYALLVVVFGLLALSLLKVKPFYSFWGRIMIDFAWVSYGIFTDHHVVAWIFALSLINSATRRPEFLIDDDSRGKNLASIPPTHNET